MNALLNLESLQPRLFLLVRSEFSDTIARLFSAIVTVDRLAEQIDKLPESLPEGNTILIVSLLSTLHESRDISGYKEFLTAYWRLRQSGRVRLVVVQPPLLEGPNTMIGYGTLVDCYITDTVAPSQLALFLQRLSDDFDLNGETSPSLPAFNG